MAATRSSEVMISLAEDLIGRHISEKDFQAHFGGPSLAVEKLWEMIQKPHAWGIDDLFIGLFFLQSPGKSWSTISSRWGIHPNTFKKHLSWTLHIIIATLPEVTKKSFIKHLLILFFD